MLRLGKPFSRPWPDGVIPLAVELMPLQPDSLQLLLRHLDLGRVRSRVQSGFDLQARRRPRRRDQLDNYLMAHQRTTTPVHRDVREEAVLDLVPLARPRREVAPRYLKPGLIGERLQFHLPEPDPIPVAPAAVGADQQVPGLRNNSSPIPDHHWRMPSTAK